MSINTFDEGLSRLEMLGGQVGVCDKLYFILANQGIKPAGMLGIMYKCCHNNGVAEFYEDYVAVEEVLVLLNIPYLIREDLSVMPGCFDKVFLYGNKKDELGEVYQAITERHHTYLEERRQLGTLFGYPATAVEAYDSKKRKMPSSLPTNFQDSPYSAFYQFVFSEDHWKEEIAIVQQQVDLALKIAPWLWEEAEQTFKSLKSSSNRTIF